MTRRDRSAWIELGLPALTVLLGMQTLRALLPLIVFLLRDRIGWDLLQLAALACGVFLTGFLTASLRQLFGPRHLLLLTAGGLALTRLAMQLWTGDPLYDLYLAIAGTVLFVLFLPAYLGCVRAGGVSATGRFALGLLLGLALDSAIHGAFGTYDVHWQTGLGPLILVVLLVLIQWALLAAFAAGTPEPTSSDGPFLPTLTWLAIGPFLFLQLIILQNLARLTALTGWTQPLAFGWLLLSHAVGLGVAARTVNRIRRNSWPLIGLLGLALAAALTPAAPSGGSAALLFLIGQVTAAMLIATILAGLGSQTGKSGLARTTVAHGVGMTLLVALLFVYYSRYDVRLPFSNMILPPLAGLIVGLCATGAAVGLPLQRKGRPTNWRPALAVAILLVLPLVELVTWHTPTPVTGNGYPVRIMTFNLHNGFDMAGFLGMEALAQAIEAEAPDVVALQEVSRGWVISGSLDMLTWLSQRLDMPAVFGPTADPVWGNAILSRYPVETYENHELPPRDLPILRAFLRAEIDVGAVEPLETIATHYHHVRRDGAIRVQQTEALLDAWDGVGPAALMGDLNAVPGEPEIELLREAGLADALDLAGIDPGYTSPADRPSRRIDYVWVTVEFSVRDVAITSGTASDHLGVAATLSSQ